MPRIKRGDAAKLYFKRRLRSEMTLAEKRLWFQLRLKQIGSLKFRRQHGIGPYIVDFYCSERSTVIEVDGDTHADEGQKARDKQKENYLRSLGLQVIRYTNEEILKNLEGVLEDLCKRIG